MLYLRLLAAGIMLGGVLLSAAEAMVRPNVLTLTPGGGAFLFEDGENLENAPVYSLGVGYQFSSNWSSELNGAYLETKQETGEEESVKGYVGRMEVLYHFRPECNLVPHLAAGLGFFALDKSGSLSAEGFAGYGVGLQYFFTPSCSLNLDGRHQLRDSNDFIASAGLTFALGEEKRDPQVIDTDGDGVIDAFDRCFDTRLGVPVDGYGCPADIDRDGVFDYLDNCAATPVAVAVDAAGCPPDSDHDGVADHLDHCPGTALDITVDDSGCPLPLRKENTEIIDSPPANVAAGSISSLVLHLEFAPKEAGLRPEFADGLQQAIRFVQAHPGETFVVEGHTDSIGPADKNLSLSQARAEAVRRYLIENGPVAPERIQAFGFGESRPVAEEGTQSGRLQNRRLVVRLAESRKK